MRQPQPEALKELKGTARKDRKRAPGPPPLRRVPAPPAGLSEELHGLWREVAREAVRSGTVTSADLGLVRDLVEVVAQRRFIEERVRQEGPMVIGSNGQPARHPLLVEARQLRALELQLRQALGMTPRARIGLDSAPPEKTSSKAAQILGFPRAVEGR